MGILFNARSWRQPLRLIDSWLPEPPAARALVQPLQALHPFARAGWLGRSTRSVSATRSTLPVGASAARPRRVRLVCAVDSGAQARPDGRVVISGPIGDVCAELDRLAALELGEHRKV